MAKVEIIRSFLASKRQELPVGRDELHKHIEKITRDMNFSLTGKELQTLAEEFAEKEVKKPGKGSKTSGTAKASDETE